MGIVQCRELDASTRLDFQGLSCWGASVALCLWSPACAVLKGLLIVPVGTRGPFWPWDSLFQAVGWGGGGACAPCPILRAWHVCTLLSKIYPDGKLQ